MVWDSTRPVPWQRLVREWFVYVGIMALVFVFFFRDQGLAGIIGGLLASGPLYLIFGFVLAKLGYRRQSLKELRAQPPKQRSKPEPEPTDRPRPKPPPTRRTGGSVPNRGRKRKR